MTNRLVAVVCSLLAVSSDVWAEPPPGSPAASLPSFPDELPADFDDADARYSDFWEQTLHPAANDYTAAVAQARRILEKAGAASDFERAAELLRAAAELDPARPLAHWWLGELYERQQRWDDCAVAFGAAFAIAPSFPSPNPRSPPSLASRLAGCLAHSGEFERAATHYTRLLANERPRSDTYQRLGDCYMALGRLAEAIEAYESAIQASERLAINYFAAAVAYDRDERVSRSRQLLESGLRWNRRAGALNASNSFFVPPADEHYYRGLIAEFRDDRAWAIAYFRKYVATAGSSPWIRRARAHLAQLQAVDFGPADISITGSATLDHKRTYQAVLRRADDLHGCIRSTRNLLVNIKITMVVRGPTTPTRAVRVGAPQAGVQVISALSFGVPAQEAARVGDCVDKQARAIKLPTPAGRPGAYAVVEFDLIAR